MTWAVAALALAALPVGSARYRFEIGGEPVGVAELTVRCEGPSCTAIWETSSRLPAEAGGALRRRRVSAKVGRDGRFLPGGTFAVEEQGGVRRFEGKPGAAAPPVAEALLAVEAPAAGERCVEVQDDQGAVGSGCARRVKDVVAMTLPGERLEVVPGQGGFPAEVRVLEQGVRFVRDPEARVPVAAPRLYGTRVRGPVSLASASRFAGIARDPPPRREDVTLLPPPRAAGASCREKTADYLARASRAGIPGRAAVGVAFDGTGFAWHAWAELRVDGRWIAVDPTFGQSPAEGPRFTVARYRPGDAAEEEAAGRRILIFWGRGEVEADAGRPPASSRLPE